MAMIFRSDVLLEEPFLAGSERLKKKRFSLHDHCQFLPFLTMSSLVNNFNRQELRTHSLSEFPSF